VFVREIVPAFEVVESGELTENVIEKRCRQERVYDGMGKGPRRTEGLSPVLGQLKEFVSGKTKRRRSQRSSPEYLPPDGCGTRNHCYELSATYHVTENQNTVGTLRYLVRLVHRHRSLMLRGSQPYFPDRHLFLPHDGPLNSYARARDRSGTLSGRPSVRRFPTEARSSL
jgi:hypothetical protein